MIEATKVVDEEEKYRIDKSIDRMEREDLKELLSKLEKEMKEAALDLQFERATELRDKIQQLKDDSNL